MRRRAALLCLATVVALLGAGTPGVVLEVAAGTPINSCGPIMQSGSYELTQSIASFGGDCIMVQAEFVTIDLKGFSVSGGGSWGTGISGWGRGLVVRDGTVRNMTAIVSNYGGTIANNVLSQNSTGIDSRGVGVSIHNNTVIDSWNIRISVMCPANIIGNTVTGAPRASGAGGPRHPGPSAQRLPEITTRPRDIAWIASAHVMAAANAMAMPTRSISTPSTTKKPAKAKSPISSPRST